MENGVRICHIYPGLIRQTGFEEGFVIMDYEQAADRLAEELENVLLNVRGRAIVEWVNGRGSTGVLQLCILKEKSLPLIRRMAFPISFSGSQSIRRCTHRVLAPTILLLLLSSLRHEGNFVRKQ
ncbi:MAG: hypothetical protein WBB45_16670 [Cyclobacteriaceae bacterium]